LDIPLETRLLPCEAVDTQTVTLVEAQRSPPDLVRQLAQEGEVLITDADRPVARLTPASPRPSLRELKPASVGAVLRPFPSTDDDLLGEMLDGQ
jgi:prevent-host-death family protein